MTRPWWGSVVDKALEGSIAGSFSAVGHHIRRTMAQDSDDWAPLPANCMEGKSVVLTGGTSGLGEVTTLALARLGAHVTMVARNAAKAERACERIDAAASTPRDSRGTASRGSRSPSVDFVLADMGDLDDVRRAARDLREKHAAVHVLIHNAGALDADHHLTAQGLEQTVATHLVGPYLLTMELRPQLARAGGARVIWVSSGGMYAEPLSVAALEGSAASYDGVVTYARAKRAQVVLAEMLADELAADEIRVHSMHPGWADTPGVARSLPTFQKLLRPVLRTPEEGADTIVWLAASPGRPAMETSKFWHDRAIRPTHKLSRTRAADTPSERARLRAWVTTQAERVSTDR